MLFCFRFSGDGKLNVLIWAAKGGRTIWSKSNNHWHGWSSASITLISREPFSVVFEGVIGPKYTAAVAIDDITLLDGSCETLTTPSMSIITQPPTPGKKESFINDYVLRFLKRKLSIVLICFF